MSSRAAGEPLERVNTALRGHQRGRRAEVRGRGAAHRVPATYGAAPGDPRAEAGHAGGAGGGGGPRTRGVPRRPPRVGGVRPARAARSRRRPAGGQTVAQPDRGGWTHLSAPVSPPSAREDAESDPTD